MKPLLPVLLLLAACTGGGSGGASPILPGPRPTVHRNPLPPITHVVVVIQENRTLDNLFQGFPGANTQNYGLNSSGQQVPLQPVSLKAPYDIDHSHATFSLEYAGGALNGWNLAPITCKPPSSCTGDTPYAYAPQSEVQPYWDMASQYVLADAMFQSNEGPSFPAHQYLLSGTSTIHNGAALRAAENPKDNQGGCDSGPKARVMLINDKGIEANSVFPCFDRLSILDELDAAGVSWKYYQAGGGEGYWRGVDALKQIWQKPEFKTNVVWPPSRVLTDISNGNLSAVSFVTPTALASDHALLTNGTGPSWVASVVNAVGASKYWNSTAVIITFDDWGGWYDHVAPQQLNSYELGFRVPLIVVSPFSKSGYVGHTQYEFGSILKTIEELYGLPSLGTTDARSTDLADMFSQSLKVRRFKKIHAAHGAAYFLRQPPGNTVPDND
jgi:phospholipase C